MRYTFGPPLHVMPPAAVVPPAAGQLPDVAVTATVPAIRAAALAGEIDVDVLFTLPAYDPTAFSPLAEVHAVAYADGQTLTADPSVAVASSQPKAMADVSGQVAGYSVTVTIHDAPQPSSAPLTVVTVLGFTDTSAPASTPAAPVASAPTAAPVPGEVAPATTG